MFLKASKPYYIFIHIGTQRHILNKPSTRVTRLETQQEISKGPNLLQINQIGKMDRNGYSSQCKLRGEKKAAAASGEPNVSVLIYLAFPRCFFCGEQYARHWKFRRHIFCVP